MYTGFPRALPRLSPVVLPIVAAVAVALAAIVPGAGNAAPPVDRPDGPVIKKDDGPVFKKDDGPVAKKDDGPVAKKEDGPVFKKDEGPVAKKDDGPESAKDDKWPPARSARLFRMPSLNFELSLPFGPDPVAIDEFENECWKARLDLGGVIYLFGAELTEDTLEEYHLLGRGLGVKNVKVVEDATYEVAGVPARMSDCTWQSREGTATHAYRVVTLVNQGVGYQFVLLRDSIDDRRPLPPFGKLLDGLRFLGDRTEWLRQEKGVARRTGLAGGLVSFEINRPRWLDDSEAFLRQRSSNDECLQFRRRRGGGWMQVYVARTTRPAKDDLAEFVAGEAAPLTDVGTRPAVLELGDRRVDYMTITGVFSGVKRLVRVAVIESAGLTVRVAMESLATRAADTAPDWKQVIGSLQIVEPKAGAAPWYPAFVPRWGAEKAAREHPPWPAGAVDVTSAEGVLVAAPAGDVLYVVNENRTTRVDGRTGRPIVGKPDDRVARGRVLDAGTDDRLVVGATDAEAAATGIPTDRSAPGIAVTVIAADGRKLHGPYASVQHPRLLPGGDLFAQEFLPDRDGATQSQFVRFSAADGSRKVVLARPRMVVHDLRPSPDGKRVAVIGNFSADTARGFRSELWVCNTDGSDLRRVAKGVWAGDLVWAPSGESVLLVSDVESSLSVHDGRDVFEFPLAPGAAPVRLTETGDVSGLARAGDDLFLRRHHAGEQKGWRRVALPALREAARALPARKPFTPAAFAESLEAECRPLLGDKPLREAVLTVELIGKLAAALDAVWVRFAGVPLPEEDAADLLESLAQVFRRAEGVDCRLIRVAIAARWGEHLRRTRGAEWHLRPIPVGDIDMAGATETANPLVRLVCPFRTVHELGDEDVSLGAGRGPAAPQQRIHLVVPFNDAPKVMAAVTPAGWKKAESLLEIGDAAGALAALEPELRAAPGNRELAALVLNLSVQAAGPEAANRLALEVVEAGGKSSDLLSRAADGLEAKDPRRATDLRRQAVAALFVEQRTYETGPLVKLGDALLAAGDTAGGDACHRAATRFSYGPQREVLLKRLAAPDVLPEPAGPPVPGAGR